MKKDIWPILALISILLAGLPLQWYVIPSAAAVAGPTLSVDVTADRHPISPDIYGMNAYSMDPKDTEKLLSELRIPVRRWGGNHTTRYNWRVDASNSGDDWFFTGGNGQANPTPGATVDTLLDTNRTAGTQSLITIPMIDHVQKTSAWSCGFSVAKYGQQQAVNPYVGNGDCGNGRKPDGSILTGNDPLDVSTANSTQLQQDWIRHLVSRHGSSTQGGVRFYALDNEPSGWSNTHRDLRLQAPTYQEIRDKTYQYAPAIKAIDPGAKIFGPVDFGWAVYVGDPAKTDGMWYAPWYLKQMKQYEQQNGKRILDYFTENFYPSPSGVANAAANNAGSAEVQAARLRSTRSLWDPTYKEENWIGQWYPPIQLIRTFHKWVGEQYPGTKIAITEYNWGAVNTMNGALAQADVLGIFGREGLDLATMWGPPKSHEAAAYSFRMYRNYDGQGSEFGDTTIRAVSSDQAQLAIYGAQRTRDGALTLMVINKTSNNPTSTVSLSGAKVATSAQVYRYSSAKLDGIVRQADQPISGNTFSATYPANSITLLVVPQAGTQPCPSPSASPSADPTTPPINNPKRLYLPAVMNSSRADCR